jgi:hypothetical protein
MKNETTHQLAGQLYQPQPQQTSITTALEDREAQQVQMAMLAAKRFPRDEKRAMDRVLNACCRESLASVAQYQYAKGGTDVSGPSIRLAEAIAQHWGNIESGWKEIDRRKDEDGVGISIVEAFAWDLETNFRVPRTFSVRHWRDTRKGGYAIADERDIYELCANQAARRVRACLLSIIPGDVVEDAQRQCDATLASKADTSPDAQKRIVDAFAAYGVTKSQLEAKIQRRIDSITAAQVIMLRKIMASLKDGVSVPGDWFEAQAEPQPQTGPDPFAERAKKSAPKPAPKPAEPECPVAEEEDELPM